MDYQEELVEFLVHFHIKRDYFECHEILEEVWQNEGRKSEILVGLIQIAVCFYHYRRNNLSGAMKLAKRALIKIGNNKKDFLALGFDYDSMIEKLKKTLTRLEQNLPYQAIELPLHDECSLLSQYHKVTQKLKATDPYNVHSFIVHKHLLRDRSEVENNRKQALKSRSKK